jgi:hypothetical protein
MPPMVPMPSLRQLRTVPAGAVRVDGPRGQQRPRCLVNRAACLPGALLDEVAERLRRRPETRPPNLPRTADFAPWATACETAVWLAGTFWSAYCASRDEE